MKRSLWAILALIILFSTFIIQQSASAQTTPTWTYYDIDENVLSNPTEKEIEELAHSRTGNGITQYAFTIRHDLSGTMGSGYLENFGNPVPAVGKHWITEGEEISPQVDGIVHDVYDINSRYVSTEYDAVGAAISDDNPVVALKFDGFDDFVSIENIDLKDKDKFSIEFWAKRSGRGEKEFLFGQGSSDSGGQGIQFYWDEDGYAWIELSDVDWPKAKTVSTTDDIQWHHWKIEYTKISSSYRIIENIQDLFVERNITGNGFKISIYRDGQPVNIHYGENTGVCEAELIVETSIEQENCHWKTECEIRECEVYDEYARAYFESHFGLKCNCEDVESCTTNTSIGYSYEDRVYTGSGTFYIGKGHGEGTNFKGQVKDFLIKVDDQKVGYWKFNDGEDSKIAEDSYSYNRDGELINFETSDCWATDPDPAAKETIPFKEIQATQNIEGFVMDSSASIIYRWKKQFGVTVNTSPDSRSDKAFLEILDDSEQADRIGSGKFWYKYGTELKLSSETDDCMQLIGYRDTLALDPNKNIPKHELKIDSLDSPVSIMWIYSQYMYEETVTIGSPVSFSTVPFPLQKRAKLTQKPLYNSNNTADGTPESEMFYWSDPENRLYPLKPDQTFQVEWDMEGGCSDDKLITRITTELPDSPHYVHVAETPPINLDSSEEDLFSFKEMKYTSADASVTGKEFSATQPGESVLLFTRSDTVSNAPLKDISLTFNGGSGYADAGNISLNRSAFTIEFWARRSGKDSLQTAVGQGNPTTGLMIGFNPYNQFMFNLSGKILTSNAAYTDTDWHHWACVYELVAAGDDIECFQCVNDPSSEESTCKWGADYYYTRGFTGKSVYEDGDWKWEPYYYANRCKKETPVQYRRLIYRDGVKVAEDTLPLGDSYIGTGSLRIGSTGEGWSPASGFLGDMDEVRVWDKARAPQELVANRDSRLEGDEEGLIGYWRLDNIGASFEDDSRILVDPATISPEETDPPEQPTLSRTCLNFNGSNDFVLMENPLPTGENFTIETWVYPEQIDTNALIGWQDDETGQRGPSLFIGSDGSLVWDSYDTGGTRFNGEVTASNLATAFFAKDRWVHVAWVKEGATYRFYRNGMLQETKTAPETVMLFDRYALGKVGDSLLKGQLDEIRIWNTARTETEIKDNYNASLTGDEPGLAAYYPVDEIFSVDPTTVTDVTANANNGTLINMNPSSATVVSPMPAAITNGNAFSFDGGDDYVDCGTGVDLANSSFTVEFWAKRARTDEWDIIFRMGENSSIDQMLHFGFRDSNVFTMGFWGDDLNTPEYTDTDWHHWACVYDSESKQQIIYRDGINVAQRKAGNHFTGTNRMYLGNWTGTSQFKGRLDEVRVWNIARPQKEILRTMNTALTGDEPALKVYYDFDQIDGTRLPDRTAEKQDGTLINTSICDEVPPLKASAEPNSALNFDGRDDYVDSGTGVDLANSSFTVEFWAKRATTDRLDTIFKMGETDSTGQMLHLGFEDSNVFTMGFWGDDLNTPIYTDTEWHHWACVYDSGSKQQIIYRDGITVAQRTADNHFTGKNRMYLGLGWKKVWWTVPTFKGLLDEVRVWNIARSQEEIQGTMDTPLGGDEPGLMVYYDFNQVSGAVLPDNTAEKQDGKLVDMSAIVDGITALTPVNQLSGALDLDGVDDYVAVPYNTELSPDQFTFEAWAYVSGGSGTWRSVIQHRGGSYSGSNIYAGRDNKWQFWMGDGSKWNVITGQPVIENVWTHLAGTYDGSTLTFYVNGKLQGTQSVVQAKNTSKPLYVGGLIDIRSQKVVYPFNGKLDEVRMWDVVRSQAEIQGSLSEILVGDEPGLQLYYTFDNRPFEDMSVAKTDALNFGPTSEFFTKSMYPFINKTYMSMDGGESYMEIPDAPSLKTNSDTVIDLTVEAWINPDEISGAESVIVSKSDPDAQKGYVMGVSTEGKLFSKIWDDDGNPFSFAAGKIVPGQWTHIAMTWETSGNLMGYVNGFKVAEIPASDVPIASSSTSLFLGRFKGRIDDVRIWHTARSQAKIKDDLLRQLTGQESDLVAYYTFDNVQNSRLKDVTPSGNDGLIVGGSLIREGLSDNIVHHPLTLVNMEPSSAWSVSPDLRYEGSPDSVVTKGIACVRVVETISAEGDGKRTGSATVGVELTSPFHEEEVPHNGYVFKEISPYNPDIYDRSSKVGSIYPVNILHPLQEPQKDKLLVVWYRMQDNIAWSYRPVEYSLSWPDQTTRIVIASRVGSEGKNKVGVNQTFPDLDENPRNYLDPARYRDVKIYNQPDKTRAGYNPNEEHGLVAPSFRHSRRAPQPVAAFALRNDLNNDDPKKPEYTSHPFVMVQYFDQTLGRHGMAAFHVEKEDTSCNYTFNYGMRAGEPVVAPYPVNVVIGATPPPEIFGKNGDLNQKCYWKDHKGQSWTISGAGKTIALSDEITEVSSAEYTLKLDSGTFTQGDSYLVKVIDGDGTVGAFKFTVGKTISNGVKASVRVNGAVVTDGSANVTVTLDPGITGLEKANFELYHYTSDAHVLSYFWYPLDPMFWIDEETPGDGTGDAGMSFPFLPTGTVAEADGFPPDMTGKAKAREIRYDVTWPDDVPILKAGETLTYPGGEYRADNGDAPGLPGVLAWAAGQVVFDDLNPEMNETKLFTDYLVRLGQVLEERRVDLSIDDLPDDFKPAAKRVDVIMNRYYFKDLHAGLRNRICYDPMTEKLIMQGFVNDRTLGDNDLTAAPPAIYVTQPNIMTETEKDTIKALEGANGAFTEAVDNLYELTRNPNGIVGADYTVGIAVAEDFIEKLSTTLTADVIDRLCNSFYAWFGYTCDEAVVDAQNPFPEISFGPGLALMPNGALLDPDKAPFQDFTEGYVTLAENNHPELGAMPVALHIVKVKKEKYRGAIKTVFSDNVFDEKVTLRHTADFGGKADELVFQWQYREEDGTDQNIPNLAPAKWKVFPDFSGKNGLGMAEIALAGAGSALLVDNLFFVRYRHKDSPEDDPTSWSNWAGAANSRPPKEGEDPIDTYQAQLCEGWIKRVLNGVNPFEARIRDFLNTDSPATYVSMIQQAGQRYEGPVAFNPAKDVIENVGLIELYQTVLDRGKDLSIDLSQPVCTSGVTTALTLAASRISGFYTLLGNEAYNDALDPTIGFGTSSSEYGSLAPAVFSFTNQVPSLLEEELTLLRGRSEPGARPVYNRLMWNFTKDRGEAAYGMNYNISDVTKDGFIDDADGQRLYPQGHGDAWGHYLTAVKTYYTLLRHPEFKWESRSEKFQIQGVVMDVDYLDERKFAEAAAAKAKVGREIVDLTYRSKYVDDPDGQWQGYKDTDKSRAWGVSEWSRRSAHAAYFDWATVNAVLPSAGAFRLNRSDLDRLKAEVPLAVYNKLNAFEDQGYGNETDFKDALTEAGIDPTPYPNILKFAEKSGLKRIDRTTVQETLEIASQARAIQKQADDANVGLNPLGLSDETVPFDIEPARMVPGAYNFATHFEQVYERAFSALKNARIVFDHANDLKNRIRQTAVSTEEFTQQVIVQDRNYRNRMIEIFGTPYEGTIGSGKLYPAGYQGPDYFLYNYIDVNETDSSDRFPEPSNTVKAFFTAGFPIIKNEAGGALNNGSGYSSVFSHFFGTDFNPGEIVYPAHFSDDIKIEYPISGAGTWSFQAPLNWGMRKSPGEIQLALIELVKAEADLKLALADYAGLMLDINVAVSLLEARSDLNSNNIDIMETALQKKRVLNTIIQGANMVAWGAELGYELTKKVEDTVIEGIPKVVGVASDATAPARAVVKTGAVAAWTPLKVLEKTAKFTSMGAEITKEWLIGGADISIEKEEYKYDIKQQLKEIELHLGNEAPQRMEIFKRQEHMRQISEKYKAVLSKGLRLMEERKAFNAKVAAKTQGSRYADMNFRIGLNDALSKYRSMYDVASRFVYLAAKAYDYETNLSDRDPAAAGPLLADLMRQRTLGQYEDGRYIIGQGGLGETLARLKTNFEVLKGQMGLSNPQSETSRMSLRYELFRIKKDGSEDDAWRRELLKHKTDNLWSVPDFRRYCRPFISETDGAQPGIVIPFTSNIISGKNFFGWPLGGGDHAYDPTHYATKVRSVGLWFEGYDNSRLSETPRAYLVPAGMDVMMVPNSTELDSREWTIVDQKIPAPLPIGPSDLADSGWFPSLDSLSGPMVQIQKFPMARAYHDSGYFNQSEMNYDSRLIGRSVWNTRWLLVIPGATFHYDPKYGLDSFISTVTDVKLLFQTYAISGN